MDAKNTCYGGRTHRSNLVSKRIIMFQNSRSVKLRHDQTPSQASYQTENAGQTIPVTQTSSSLNQTCITMSQEDLALKMRELWAEHVIWTRMFIMSVADNTADKAAVTERLLKNYEDMASAMKLYYGNDTGNKFGDLIEEHLLTAAALVEAAKAGNNTAADTAEKKWYENADEIAVFESSINPYWNKTALMAMWHDHLKLTKDEAVARLTGNYAADIEAFDSIETQANMMADSMANGIVEQFPDKFRM